VSQGLEARIRRLEDIHEIGQLRARYCHYLDDGRWDELAELFTLHGRFIGQATAVGSGELGGEPGDGSSDRVFDSVAVHKTDPRR
jgi:hypothetical protein